MQQYLLPSGTVTDARRHLAIWQTEIFIAKLFLLHWSEPLKNIVLSQNNKLPGNHSWALHRFPTEQSGQPHGPFDNHSICLRPIYWNTYIHSTYLNSVSQGRYGLGFFCRPKAIFQSVSLTRNSSFLYLPRSLSLYTPCDNVLSHGVFDTERVTETERAGKNTLSTKILPKAWDNAGEFWERWVRDI